MRLEKLEPEKMTDRQREVAEKIAGRRGSVRGPFQVWLNSPEAGERIESLGAFLRFDSSIPLRLRELSLLLAARNWDAQYSWNAHADKAVEAGIPRAALEAIARHEEPAFDNDEDGIFYRFCQEILKEHFVGDDTFAAALKVFGPQGLVDTVASLGNFTMLGMCLNTFQVDLQADREPPYPDIEGYGRVSR
jgi:4-carboxymuconolactone decarboxylase